MTRFRLLFFSFNFILILGATAQTKNEKESRISMAGYPKNTQKVLQHIPEKAKRIRHYQETDGNKLSYESKFKYNSYWFSVEFNKEGVLEDIEKTIKEKKLPKEIDRTLQTYLESEFDKNDIIKIQEQYLYSNHISEEKFLKSILENSASISSNYEIIIATKKDKEWTLKEMTFDPKGQFLNSRDLTPSSYENIMY